MQMREYHTMVWKCWHGARTVHVLSNVLVVVENVSNVCSSAMCSSATCIVVDSRVNSECCCCLLLLQLAANCDGVTDDSDSGCL
jgi:hypothetical protein